MSLTTDIFGNKFSSQAVFSTAGLMRVRKGGEKILFPGGCLIDDLKTVKNLYEIGVDGIITDYPDRVSLNTIEQ